MSSKQFAINRYLMYMNSSTEVCKITRLRRNKGCEYVTSIAFTMKFKKDAFITPNIASHMLTKSFEKYNDKCCFQWFGDFPTYSGGKFKTIWTIYEPKYRNTN